MRSWAEQGAAERVGTNVYFYDGMNQSSLEVGRLQDRTVEFERFVAVTQRRLLGVAYLLTQDMPLAEDLVQEALLKVYRRWRREAMATHPEAYVRRVIVNEFLSTRRRRSSTEVAMSTSQLPESPMTGGSPVERLTMWQALATLPDRQRAVLVLRCYEDLTDREIADHLGCAEGTVRSLAARAYATLRNDAGLFDRATSRSEERS